MWERAIYPLGKAEQFLCRGMVYQHLEMQNEALADFTEAINRHKSLGKKKNLQYCYYRRGFVLKVLRRYSEAADDFEMAKQLDPMNPYLNVNYRNLKGVNYVPIQVPGELEFRE